MAGQIIFGGNITPTNTPMEVSYNGGTTWIPLTYTTIGSNQQGTLASVPPATYAIGQLVERAIGYPGTAQANTLALTVVAASSGSFSKTRFIFFGEADNAGNTATQFTDLSTHNNHFPQPNAINLPAKAAASDGLVGYTMGSGKYFDNGLNQPVGDFVFYAVMKLDTAPGSMYMYDTQGHGLLLGSGPDGLYYQSSSSGHGGGIALPVGSRFIVRYGLSAAGTTVSVNEHVIYSGTYAQTALSGGRLGCDFSSDGYGAIPGSIFAFAVASGIETAAQISDTHAYLKTKNNISY